MFRRHQWYSLPAVRNPRSIRGRKPRGKSLQKRPKRSAAPTAPRRELMDWKDRPIHGGASRRGIRRADHFRAENTVCFCRAFSKSSWKAFCPSPRWSNSPMRDGVLRGARSCHRRHARVAVAAVPAGATAQGPANSNGTSGIKSACAPNGSIRLAQTRGVLPWWRGIEEGRAGVNQRTGALEICRAFITFRTGRVTTAMNFASGYQKRLCSDSCEMNSPQSKLSRRIKINPPVMAVKCASPGPITLVPAPRRREVGCASPLEKKLGGMQRNRASQQCDARRADFHARNKTTSPQRTFSIEVCRIKAISFRPHPRLHAGAVERTG